MRRTTPLTAVGLLGLVLLAPTTSASATGETCRGEAATIVGTGASLTGTEGRDVIVTARAGVVDALGGDDLICVAPDGVSSNVLVIDAGTGNDVVDTTATDSNYYVTTRLGGGADTFEGGAASDTVLTGDSYGNTAEVDTVRAGAGHDSVTTSGGSDVIYLGPGTDRLELQGVLTTPEGLLAGGGGDDTLRMTVSSPYGETFDMATGTYRNEGATARFSSFEGLGLDTYSADIGYSGTEGPDHLTVSFLGPGGSYLHAEMLGGDDDLELSEANLWANSSLDMGAGEDRIVAARSSGSLDLSLKHQQLEVNGALSGAVGAEDAFLMAPDVTMVGDAQDNTLVSLACTTSITGGHGDDELIWDRDYIFEEYSYSCTKSADMRGGPGNDSFYGSPGDDRLFGDGDRDTIRGGFGDDRILGGKGADRIIGERGRDHADGGPGRDRAELGNGNDVFVGGPGRDRVDGKRGRDTCQAERRESCER